MMDTQTAPVHSAETWEDYKSAPDNEDLGHIPGDYGLPLLGHSIRASKNLLAFFIDKSGKYGPVFRTRLGRQKSIVALGADINQQILLDRKQDFSSQMGYEYSMSPFFGGGLMLRDFGEHRLHRRIMQAAFKVDALKSYIDIMNRKLSEHLDSWRGVERFVFYSSIKPALLEVAAEIFIGVHKDDPVLPDMNRAFLETVSGMGSLVHVNLPGFRYHKAIKARQYLHSYFHSLLPSKRSGERRDMFAHFAQEHEENGNMYSDSDVVEHIHFLMMAAHDTTTSALSNCVAALVTYPEWQHRLREEARGLSRETLAYEDLDTQEYLQLFMHEVLRLHGPVPMSMRRTTNDVRLGDYDVPAHTVLGVAPCYTHHMEEWWDEPRRFDPERFNAQRSEQKRHSFSYIPFGGGAHKCIGMHFAMMQIRCFLHQMLLRYDMRLPDNYRMPIQFEDVPFPHPKDGLPLILKPLN